MVIKNHNPVGEARPLVMWRGRNQGMQEAQWWHTGGSDELYLRGDWPRKSCDVKETWEFASQTSQARTF